MKSKGNIGLLGAFLSTRKTLVLLVCSVMLIPAGCTPVATEYRLDGFHCFHRSFAQIDDDPNLYEVIELEKVKIYIVGQRQYFKWEEAAAYGSPLQGYATDRNEIFVFGKRVGDQIIVDQSILGHELNHLLNFSNPSVTNPDQLSELGL
jgi:hypothetical protein